MSADVRLDAATVSEIARRLKATWGGTAKAAALRWAGEVVAQMTTDESAPPTLSSWVAACEGTALGEPSDVHVRMYAGNEREVLVENYDDGASLTVVGGGCSSYEWHATPAELRAALERLAGGEAPR